MGSCNMANPTTSHPQWGFIQFILGYSPIFMIYNDALLLEIWSHPSLIFIHTTSNSLGENGTWLLRDFHQKNHVLGATWPRNTHQKLVWGKAKLLLFFLGWVSFVRNYLEQLLQHTYICWQAGNMSILSFWSTELRHHHRSGFSLFLWYPVTNPFFFG